MEPSVSQRQKLLFFIADYLLILFLLHRLLLSREATNRDDIATVYSSCKEFSFSRECISLHTI